MESTILGVDSRKSSRSLVSTEIVPLSDLQKLASQRQLYAILDACDAPAVPTKVKGLGEEIGISLYRGEAEEDYWAIAPYLVRVDPSLLDWIIITLWEQSWGISSPCGSSPGAFSSWPKRTWRLSARTSAGSSLCGCQMEKKSTFASTIPG